MPPKAKFTKEEIVVEAFKIVRQEGMQALTARSLGNSLKSSARPIFTVFKSMDEVQYEVLCHAKQLYDKYISDGLQENPAFKGVGKAYIRFAIEEPKLFQLLFMNEQKEVPDVNSVLRLIDYNNEKILKSIKDGYGLNDELSKLLYLHLWIYSHGIAVLLATKVCNFSADEISVMLTHVCSSLLKKIKEEGKL